MELRDHAEHAIRRFHALEIANGADPIIDYDCAPTGEPIDPYPDRIAALTELIALAQESSARPRPRPAHCPRHLPGRIAR